MSSYILLLIFLTPFIGALFTLLSNDNKNYSSINVYWVSLWTSLIDIALILYVLLQIDPEKTGIQFIEKYAWLDFPKIEILFGADMFSVMLLLGINLAFFIAESNSLNATNTPKNLFATQLLFNSFFNGYLLAADIVSFYIFFAAISIPLIIFISSYGTFYKKNVLVKFSLYNFIGILLLFIAVLLIYIFKNGNIPLNTAGNLNLDPKLEYCVWFSLLFAFISRLPIWPFHYWIAAINSSLRQPMVFLAGNLIPLVGVYGFMRFWPNTVPETVGFYTPVWEIICVGTMLFIALISIEHKEFKYKLFAYTTIYYLLYLIGIFLPTSGLKMNIGYSFFAYINIITVLAFLNAHIEKEKKRLNIYSNEGVLCFLPKASLAFSLFILASIGLPITPLFLNNFIIISEIFNYNLFLGVFTISALLVVGISLLEEMYCMKDKNYTSLFKEAQDISTYQFIIYLVCLIILFLSFFKPFRFIL